MIIIREQEVNPRRLGKAIKDLMAAEGLTYRAAATRCGVSYATLYGIANASHRRVLFATIERIAKGLGVTTDALCGAARPRKRGSR